MVWALAGPRGLGDFFPNGDYVGWEEGIKRYFDEEMSPAQRAAYDNWDVAFRGEVSRKFTDDRGCTNLCPCGSLSRKARNTRSRITPWSFAVSLTALCRNKALAICRLRD